MPEFAPNASKPGLVESWAENPTAAMAAVRRRFREHGAAAGAFEQLVTDGCHPVLLLCLLHLLQPTPRDVPPRKLDSLAATIGKWVEVLEAAKRDHLGVEELVIGVVQLEVLQAACVRERRQSVGKQQRNDLLSGLLRIIKALTGRPHYREVDALLPSMGIRLGTGSERWARRHQSPLDGPPLKSARNPQLHYDVADIPTLSAGQAHRWSGMAAWTMVAVRRWPYAYLQHLATWEPREFERGVAAMAGPDPYPPSARLDFELANLRDIRGGGFHVSPRRPKSLVPRAERRV